MHSCKNINPKYRCTQFSLANILNIIVKVRITVQLIPYHAVAKVIKPCNNNKNSNNTMSIEVGTSWPN